MDFKQFAASIDAKFQHMCTEHTHFFEADIDADVLYEHYLNSWPQGTNEIFRKRRKNDCSACRHFIKRIGNVVAISGNKIETIWDIKAENEYSVVAKAMSDYVKQFPIKAVFVTCDSCIGHEVDLDRSSGEIIEFHHLHTYIPEAKRVRKSKEVNETRAAFQANHDVFESSLIKINLEAVNTVIDLIHQNSLYRGEEWIHAIEQFKDCLIKYNQTEDEYKPLYVWKRSTEVGPVVSRIKNHSIGTLLVDISDGRDLNEAVTAYERIVAPSNYKRPNAIFSKRMLEDAKNTITELGYIDSLPRRFATLDDITVNNILFSNKDASKRIEGASDVFAALEKMTVNKPQQFGKVEEISIDSFINNVLPTATQIEAFVENKHRSNFVSLIAPKISGSASMFKWSNNFSWAYAGNLADSDIRRNVKAAGGDINGVLRFSIQWNDASDCVDDLDAHCHTPSGSHIYYGHKEGHPCRGSLDVDITHPTRSQVAVENITFPAICSLERGVYEFDVNCYMDRGGASGFKAEIEFDGTVYRFEYPKPLKQDQTIQVAAVKWDGEKFTLVERLQSIPHDYSQTIWNVATCKFTPVTVMCYSPNYWDEQSGIGNKHYMFMLKDCISEDSPNGFYNEYLKNELTSHKRVFEALGSQCRAEYSEDQLSGLGFSSTVRNDLLVKVTGNTERMLRIKF